MQLVEAFLRNDESHKLCLNSFCRPCSCFSFVLFCRSPINNRTGVLQNAYTHYHDIFDYLIHEIISGRKARDLSTFWLQRPCSCCPFVFPKSRRSRTPREHFQGQLHARLKTARPYTARRLRPRCGMRSMLLHMLLLKGFLEGKA